MDSKYTKFPLQEALNRHRAIPDAIMPPHPLKLEKVGYATDKHKPPLPPNSFVLITYTLVTSHINF